MATRHDPIKRDLVDYCTSLRCSLGFMDLGPLWHVQLEVEVDIISIKAVSPSQSKCLEGVLRALSKSLSFLRNTTCNAKEMRIPNTKCWVIPLEHSCTLDVSKIVFKPVNEMVSAQQ